MDTITKIIFGVMVLVFVGVVAGAYFVTNNRPVAQADVWKDTDVPCIRDPQNATGTAPILAELTITIDGREQPIPAAVGISDECAAEVHTLDDSGTVQVRPVNAEDPPVLRDFFAVGGVPFDIPNATRTVRVDGEIIENAGDRAFADGQQIQVSYELEGASQATATSAATQVRQAAPEPQSARPPQEQGADDLRFGL